MKNKKKEKIDINPVEVFSRQTDRMFEFINFGQLKAKALEYELLMLYWLNVLIIAGLCVAVYINSSQVTLWIIALLLPISNYWFYLKFLGINISKKIEDGNKTNNSKN